jgi:HAD superfamily hydrolase (TIGR01509 family)
MTLKGVILDIDGTLIDSNDAHARAWVDALAERGYQASLEQVRRMIGMGGDKVLPKITGLAKESPEGEAISRRRAEIFRSRYLPGIRPLPGVRDLLQHIHDRGLALVVATSAKQDEVEALLHVAGVNDLVGARTTSSDAKHSKPDPDIVEVALDRLGEPSQAAIMLGDTPYDVQAAQRAGVPIIAFRSGGWEDADLAGAVAVYQDPADLLRHYDESPLHNGQGSSHGRQ